MGRSIKQGYGAAALLALVLVTTGCSSNDDTEPSPSPTADQSLHILAGRVIAPTQSIVVDVAGRITVVGDCVVLAGSTLGNDLPVVWPQGTTVSVDSADKISLMNGSFLIGDEIGPAQGWTTTLGELPPDVVEGLDTACNTGKSAAAIVLSKVTGMPAQE